MENALPMAHDGHEFRFMFLPEGHDPDTLVASEGAEAFESRLQSALPLSALGHNRYCSVAMTTGGPDAADVYEEELNPEYNRSIKLENREETKMLMAGKGINIFSPI